MHMIHHLLLRKKCSVWRSDVVPCVDRTPWGFHDGLDRNGHRAQDLSPTVQGIRARKDDANVTCRFGDVEFEELLTGNNVFFAAIPHDCSRYVLTKFVSTLCALLTSKNADKWRKVLIRRWITNDRLDVEHKSPKGRPRNLIDHPQIQRCGFCVTTSDSDFNFAERAILGLQPWCLAEHRIQLHFISLEITHRHIINTYLYKTDWRA
mmetsp:Transcript_2783/g.10019  ORF Transcript_2783/g.10019 Transcript_2783/m.10019 type:complete len:207 (+) Transcript_2783:1810-2430(+)